VLKKTHRAELLNNNIEIEMDENKRQERGRQEVEETLEGFEGYLVPPFFPIAKYIFPCRGQRTTKLKY